MLRQKRCDNVAPTSILQHYLSVTNVTAAIVLLVAALHTSLNLSTSNNTIVSEIVSQIVANDSHTR